MDGYVGRITNPLTVIEQLTYLMFIRSLDEREVETESFEIQHRRIGKQYKFKISEVDAWVDSGKSAEIE